MPAGLGFSAPGRRVIEGVGTIRVPGDDGAIVGALQREVRAGDQPQEVRIDAKRGRHLNGFTAPKRNDRGIRVVDWAGYQNLAARLNQLESDAARPSPLHQAIADEIRRAAGAR